MVSIAGEGRFDVARIKIEVDEQAVSVSQLLESDEAGRQQLVGAVHDTIIKLNDGYPFEQELATEWTSYLTKLMAGHGKYLINPYSDLEKYTVETISSGSLASQRPDAMRILSELPNKPLQPTPPHDSHFMQSTLFIVAIGGTDSSFYAGLKPEAVRSFSRKIYGDDLFDCFDQYGVGHMIPRGFAAKSSEEGKRITNVESMILQAYHTGMRTAAIIGNARTKRAIEAYLKDRLGALADLSIIVTAQPLLPIIKADHESDEILITAQNGGYQGGHGHGFKYCLRNAEVQKHVRENGLKHFLFGNGDNAVMLNWGARHYVETIKAVEKMKANPEYKKLRIAFFMVWEYLRKGGFVFLLTHKETGEQITQIFEAELAEKSGADISRLRVNRGGYNTNVAVGSIASALAHLQHLPLALKKKKKRLCTHFLFEASLGTAMTTFQDDKGRSYFDAGSSLSILGPTAAEYQHWNHISTRKRDDYLAFFSSLYKIQPLDRTHTELSVIVTDRDATMPYPVLQGDIADMAILNSAEFFEIFRDAIIDVDDFLGTLQIDFLREPGKPLGRIRFEGEIKLRGKGTVALKVPAGENLILKNCELSG